MVIFLFFLVYLLVYFWPIIANKNWLWEDFAFIYFPLKDLVISSWQMGKFPLLNDFILGGQSLIADIAAGIFYPLNVFLALFWSSDFVFNYWLLEMFVILHLIVAFFGMYWLARKVFDLRKSAAVLAGLVFVFSSFFILHLKHVGMVLSGVWLPFVWGGYYYWRQGQGLRYAWLAVTAMVFSNLAGHLQIIYYIYLFLGWTAAWLIWQKYQQNRREFIKIAIREMAAFGLFVVLTLAGAAVQFLPFLELLFVSIRSQSAYYFSSSYSLDFGQYLINLFLPHIFGGYGFGVPYFGRGNFWENVSYIGLPVVFLLLLFGWIIWRRSRIAVWFSLTFLFFLLLAVGDNFFLHFIATKILWGFDKLRAPARLTLIVNFAAAMVIAFVWHYLILTKGLKEQLKKILSIKKAVWFGFILFWLLVASIFWIKRWQVGSLGVVEVLDFFWLVTVAGLFYSLFKRQLSGQVSSVWFSRLFVLLVAVDLFFAGFLFNLGATSPRDYYGYYPEINLLARQARYDNFRVLIGDGYLANAGMVKRLPLLNGYHYLFTPYFEKVADGNFHDFKKNNIKAPPAVLSMYNVKYFLPLGSDNKPPAGFIKQADGIYYNPNSYGLVWLPDKVVVLPDELILRRLRSGRATKSVAYISDQVDWAEKVGLAGGEIKQIKKDDNYLRVQVKTDKQSFLVFSQSWLPGWQGYINGSPTKVYRVNYSLLGMRIPPGENKIDLVYQPKTYLLGLRVSLFVWIVIVFGWVWFVVAFWRKKIWR